MFSRELGVPVGGELECKIPSVRIYIYNIYLYSNTVPYVRHNDIIDIILYNIYINGV